MKKKIIFLLPELNEPSGGNIVNSWIIEALKDEYELTIMSWALMDIAYVNSVCGTSLSVTDFETKIPAKWIRSLIDIIPDNEWHFQRYCLLMRWCKLIGHHYDVLIAANNECDFGRRGIQYIHYPYMKERYWDEIKILKNSKFMIYLFQLLKYWVRPWRILSGFSFQRMKRNLTLVNSHWTGSVFKNAYDVDYLTVYPPIPGDFLDVPWESKENGFVCIGRISNEKRYEVIIDILTEVRKQFPDIHLHIIGSYVDYDKDYYDSIMKKIKKYHDWIKFHENISHDELVKLVCRHRYGIHGMLTEHFGIAVGEMVRGGNIVFAPDDGGQVEILGNEQRLLFKNSDDAVKKILYVLSNKHEQISLQKHLASQKQLFISDKFKQRIQEVVRNFTYSENNST